MTMPAAAHSIHAGKNEPNIFCVGEVLQPARDKAASCFTAMFRYLRLNPFVSTACQPLLRS